MQKIIWVYSSNKIFETKNGLFLRLHNTLDHLIDVHDLEVVDLLCMNIEGAERQAVLGMAQSVGKIRRVAIACHDFRADEEGDESMRTKQAVTAFLVQHGFSIVEGDTARYGAAADDWVAATNTALLPS